MMDDDDDAADNDSSNSSPDSGSLTDSPCLLLWLLLSSFSCVLASSARVTDAEPSASGLCTVVKVLHQLDNAPRAWDRAPPVHIQNIYR
jgi:hypothetical protein